MNFGDKLKKLRQDKGLTQPELADAMGIEQSYLSKLENGKSLPSNDMLSRIIDVFGITIGDLLDGLEQGERNRLRQIPAIADHLNGQRQITAAGRRRWVALSAVLVALGIGLTFAGGVDLFFPDVIFEYKSDGIVLEGESKEIFRNAHASISIAADLEERARVLDGINARIDEAYLQSDEFRGTIFNVPVEGGSRTYYLKGEIEIEPWQNKAISFIGLMLLILGAIGLGLQSRAYPG